MKFLIQTVQFSHILTVSHMSNFLRVRELTAEQTVAVSKQQEKSL